MEKKNPHSHGANILSEGGKLLLWLVAVNTIKKNKV